MPTCRATQTAVLTPVFANLPDLGPRTTQLITLRHPRRCRSEEARVDLQEEHLAASVVTRTLLFVDNNSERWR